MARVALSEAIGEGPKRTRLEDEAKPRQNKPQRIPLEQAVQPAAPQPTTSRMSLEEAVAAPAPGGGGVADTAKRSYADVAGGVGSAVEGAGEAVGWEGAENLGRSIQDYWGGVSEEAEESGGVSVPDTLKGGYAELASGLGSIMDYAGKRFGNRGWSDTGESMKAYWNKVAEENPLSETASVSPYDDPSVLADPNWWIENTTRMAPSFAVPAGVGGFAFKTAAKALPGLPKVAAMIGAGVGGLFGGGLEGAQTYEEGIEMGQDESTAARAGEAMALGSGVLNAIPFYKILNPGARGVIRRFMASGLSEGITEAAEEPLDAIIQGLVYDKETDWEDVARSALHVAGPAFLLGGLVGAGSPAQKAPDQAPPPGAAETPPGAPETPSQQPAGELAPGLEQDEAALTGTTEAPVEPVEDVALVGETAPEQQTLADRMAREFPEEAVEPGMTPEAAAPVVEEPLPTADVVPLSPDETITMEGGADPDLMDFMERRRAQQPGITPQEAPQAPQPVPAPQVQPEAEAVVPSPPQEPQQPVTVTSPEQLNEIAQQAATSPENALTEPTDGQKQAGNYRKPKVRLNGLDISIENPRGSTRAGADQTGREWSQELKDHYGYIRGTVGRDKDHLDVFLADNATDSSRPVFVVDQVNPDGSFDEHKIVMGSTNEKQARRVYNRNYEKGWQGLGAITKMSQDEFKDWTQGDTTKPLALPGRTTQAKAKATPTESEKAAPQTAQETPESDLIGQYVRSGSTTGRVASVSEDGKKATLESGGTVPVGRAPNWKVQDQPFEAAKESDKSKQQDVEDVSKKPAQPKKKAKKKAAPKKEAAKKPAKEAEKQVDLQEDVGENLWYNRRNFTGKGIQWGDVKDLNDTLKLKEVVKSKVWVRPDYEQLVDDGMNPLFARIIKNVYDGVAAKPQGTSDEALQTYISAVNKVREQVFEWAKDNHSNREFLRMAMGRIQGEAGVQSDVESGKAIDVTTLLKGSEQAQQMRSVLLDRIWPSEKGKPGYASFNRESEAGKEVRAIGGNRALKNLQISIKDITKFLDDIGEGWPAKREAWQRTYRVAKTKDEARVGKGYRYSDEDRSKQDVYFARIGVRTIGTHANEADAQAEIDALPEWILMRKKGGVVNYFPTREEAVEAAREKTQRRKGQGGDLRGMNIGESKRVGPERREKGQDISSQELMDTFGFRGVNFGRKGWINAAERQEYLNAAYDGLLDLAEILEVPPKAISLDGVLGIAFGAQGRGGQAAAHFVPGVNEINLTKTQGAGTLAHEWGHALDHYFAVQAGLSKANDPFLSAYAGNKRIKDSDIRPEVVQGFKKIVDAMNRRNETPEEHAERIKRTKDRAGKSLNEWLRYTESRLVASEANQSVMDRFKEYADRIRKGDLGEYEKSGNKAFPETVAGIRNLFKEATGRLWGLDNVNRLNMDAISNKTNMERQEADQKHIPVATQYARESRKKDKEKGGKAYWSTEWEMFARAFETYVASKLVEQQRLNTFLSDAHRRAEARGTDDEVLQPYPRETERAAINSAFDDLVNAVETRETDQGVGLYSMAENPMETLWSDIETSGRFDLDSESTADYAERLGVSPEVLQSAVDAHNEAVARVERSRGKGLPEDDNPQVDGLALELIRDQFKERALPITNPTMRWFDTDMMFDVEGVYESFVESEYNGDPDLLTPSLKRQVAERYIQKANAAWDQILDAGLSRVGDPMFSKGTARGGMTVSEAHNALRQMLGKKAHKRLVESGRFKIVQEQSELEQIVGERAERGGRVKGMFDPASKQSYLVAGNISPDNLWGLFLHEVGAHYGLPRMIGQQEYAKVKKQLQNLHRLGNKKVVAARNRVPRKTPEQYIWDETLAYLAENPANREMSLVQRVIAKIKAFLKELGILHAMDLKPNDIVELVRGAAVHAARTAPKASPVVGEGQPLFSKSKKRVSRDKLKDMGMDFENLPGDEQGNPTEAQRPVDEEPGTVDAETAREQLRKRGFEDDGPMFSMATDAQDRGTVAHMVTGEERPTFHPSTQQQNKLKNLFRRYFTKEGLLTDEAFQRHIESMGIKNEDELVAQFMVDGMVKAARQSYKKPWSKISEQDKANMNEYLAGNNQVDIPAKVKSELDAIRTSLDNLSGRVQQMLIDEIMYRLHALNPEKRGKAMELIRNRNEELTEEDFEGVDPIVVRKIMMYRTIEGNKRQYLNRSYAVFDNEKWADEVAPEVKDRARQYLRQQVEDDAKLSQMSENAKDDYVEGVMNKILQPKARDLMSFMNSEQLGQKDLSIMKKRKDIAPEIRELMGEYKDPRLNYTRSLGKMSYLVANHHFLRSVREDGLGVFLSAKPSGRMSEEITSWDENQMAPLAGLYAAPEFAAALKQAVQPRVVEGWLRSYLIMNTGVKYGKTVLSPTTMARNFYSAALFTVMNGHFDWSYALKAGSHTWADLGSSNPKKMQYLRKLVKLGVLHDNPRAQELREAMDEVSDMNAIEGSLPARGLKTVLNAATKMYRAGDDFWKIIGFENTKAELMKSGMAEDAAEKLAADRIRNGYPTYSMVPESIRMLRRFPLVGTFVSFPWEIMRTTSHQFRMMSEDRKAGRNSMVAKRATGMAVAGGLAYGISQATMAIFGLSDDDDEAFRRMGPEWQMNAMLAYLGYDDEGHMRYLDLSHLDPYTYLKIPFIAFANGNYETVDEKAVAAMTEFLEPFLGTEIGFGALLDVWTNSTEYGPVYDENADVVTQGKQALDHLRKELQPGVFSNIERTLMAWREEYASYGRKYDIGDEALAWVGFRMTTMDPSIALRFRSFEFNDQISGASQPTYRKIRDPNIGAHKEIPGAVQESKQRWRESFRDMQAAIRAADKVGMERKDIVDALLWGGVAKKNIGALLNGRVPPWRPHRPTLNKAKLSIMRTRKDPDERRELMEEFNQRMKVLNQELSQ